jgi:hypothetical protein
MDPEQLQAVVDQIRGELDREHGQEPGWSGPITSAYLRGYCTPPRAAEHREREAYQEAHCQHGWY